MDFIHDIFVNCTFVQLKQYSELLKNSLLFCGRSSGLRATEKDDTWRGIKKQINSNILFPFRKPRKRLKVVLMQLYVSQAQTRN